MTRILSLITLSLSLCLSVCVAVCLSVSLLSIVVVSLYFVYVYVYCLLCFCVSVHSVCSLVSCAVVVVLLFVPLVCWFFFVVCRRRCVSLCVSSCVYADVCVCTYGVFVCMCICMDMSMYVSISMAKAVSWFNVLWCRAVLSLFGGRQFYDSFSTLWEIKVCCVVRRSMVAALKLEGIDERAPPGGELAAQFASTRVNSPGLDTVRIDRLFALSWFYGWCCMAVLTWWCDLCG